MPFHLGSKRDEKDLENGDPKDRRASFLPQEIEGGDEYSNLLKYINTYREQRRKSVVSSDVGDKPKGGPKWYNPMSWFAKTEEQAAFETPDDWLETTLQAGLTTSEVETRRRRAGFNELTTEKENMFLKFLGYFTGPILYGKLPSSLNAASARRSGYNWLILCQSWNLLSSWLLVFVNGSISVSSLLFSCSTPLSVGTKKSKLPTWWPR